MNIKRATINDFFSIEKMSRAFYEESGLGKLYGVDIDEDSMIQFLVSFLSEDNKVVFFCEDKGLIMGVLLPWFFNTNVLMAQEMAWYVSPDARKSTLAGRLYKAFEKWAADNQAKIFVMGSLPGLNGKRVDNFYVRKGMANTENVYGKKLC